MSCNCNLATAAETAYDGTQTDKRQSSEAHKAAMVMRGLKRAILADLVYDGGAVRLIDFGGGKGADLASSLQIPGLREYVVNDVSESALAEFNVRLEAMRLGHARRNAARMQTLANRPVVKQFTFDFNGKCGEMRTYIANDYDRNPYLATQAFSFLATHYCQSVAALSNVFRYMALVNTTPAMSVIMTRGEFIKQRLAESADGFWGGITVDWFAVWQPIDDEPCVRVGDNRHPPRAAASFQGSFTNIPETLFSDAEIIMAAPTGWRVTVHNLSHYAETCSFEFAPSPDVCKDFCAANEGRVHLSNYALVRLERV